MKNIKFNKQCNVTTLTLELDKAGYAIHGCSNSGNETTIHLKDEETKDPSIIVNAHTYTEPEKPKDYKKAYSKAKTVEEKIDCIAERLNLR